MKHTNKIPFGRPKQRPDDIPDHIPKGKTVPHLLQNVTIEDFLWVGDDGNLDVASQHEHLASPAELLKLVVSSIVTANPTCGIETNDSRVNAALAALLGQSDALRGRPELSSDDWILKKMADEYLLGFFGLKPQYNSLNALADWALKQEPKYGNGSVEWQQNRSKTIIRKFQRKRDALLLQQSTRTDEDMKAAQAKVEMVLKAIETMGIKVRIPARGGQNPSI